MKRIAAIFSLFLFWACGDKTPEPENKLSEQQMEDILYDINIMQGIKAFKPVLLPEKHAYSEYIFKKYNIDSTTLAQNQAYYAADIDRYAKIYERVSERVKSQKEALAPKKDSTSAKPVKADTITKE